MNKAAEITEIPAAMVVINVFMVVSLIVIAVYFVLKIRDFAAGKMPKNGEYVNSFERMRDKGLIDDKELDRVKSAVGKSAGESGDKKGDDGFVG